MNEQQRKFDLCKQALGAMQGIIELGITDRDEDRLVSLLMSGLKQACGEYQSQPSQISNAQAFKFSQGF